MKRKNKKFQKKGSSNSLKKIVKLANEKKK